MQGYVKKALKLFQHQLKFTQDAPYPSVPIWYGAKQQYATQESTAPPLDANDKKFIQQVCGKFLFLGRAIDVQYYAQSAQSQPNHPSRLKKQCYTHSNS
jgi:hypothetical protein